MQGKEVADLSLHMVQAKNEISALISAFRALGALEGGLIALADDILDVLDKHGLIVETQLSPKFVGVHPMNRKGVGLIFADVFKLLKAIFLSEWSWRELGNALSLQLPPVGDKEGDAMRRKNSELAQQSDGHLADTAEKDIQSVTLTCGHTNATLRCLLYGTKCPDRKHPLNHDGRLSLAKLNELRPRYYNATQVGIKFRQLRWEVQKHVPEAIRYLIEADNIVHQNARQDSEFTVIREIIARSQEQPPSDDAEWTELANAVGMYRPLHEAHCGDYCTWVRIVKNPADAIANIEGFVKQLHNPRSVRGALWSAIAANFLEQAPEYATGLLKATFATEKHEGWRVSPVCAVRPCVGQGPLEAVCHYMRERLHERNAIADGQ